MKAILSRLFAKPKSGRESIVHNSASRRYPELPATGIKPKLPISFVVIRFSDEYRHNFLESDCVHDHLNQVIEIDNTSNLHFDNLTRAIAAGLNKAQNDIIAVIHEDVFLPVGWQSQFEKSLRQLEQHDPTWGMLGSVGWNASGEFIGHWSDPHQFKNTFEHSQHEFQEAEKLDEQLLIMHRSRMPNLDANLPGIHFLGDDLKHDLAHNGLRCYAVNAPTIHKYADKYGGRILSSVQSDKISDRESATYLADEACCKDYVHWKYPDHFPLPDLVPAQLPLDADKQAQLERPVIFVCIGESESALLRGLADSLGIYLGGKSDKADDCLELMIPVYKMVIEKFRCHASWQKSYTASTLPAAAAHMIRGLPPNQCWGFIFPESILVLPELRMVFPRARYVYVQRDPLDLCTGETQRTARLDNHIGRIALPEAYRYMGMEAAQILDDDELDHMVATTIHQLELVNQHREVVTDSGSLMLRFEDLVEQPELAIERLSNWLGSLDASRGMRPLHIKEKMRTPTSRYSTEKIAVAAARLAEIRSALGYI